MRHLTLGLALTLVACAVPPEPKIEETTFAQTLGVDLAASIRTASGLYLRDKTGGDGEAAPIGARVTMRYTGWLVDGTQFDSNQTTGFRFTLGAGEVIPGWDEGCVGMKVGGTRQLIIPPALAYGAAGVGPIPPQAILVFDVTRIAP